MKSLGKDFSGEQARLDEFRASAISCHHQTSLSFQSRRPSVILIADSPKLLPSTR